MSTGVVVPLLLTDEHRTRAWDHVSSRMIHDGWPIMEGHYPGGVWCKAVAVQVALEWHRPGPADVLVVMDADVVLDLGALRAAVRAVESGEHAWAIPHTEVHRLTQRATDRYLVTGEAPEHAELTRWPYVGVEGGGCVVLRRRTYDEVPLDTGFLGWGEEDICWGMALRTLAGAPWRAPERLIHLWHPHAVGERQARSPRWESDTLRRRYMAARDDPGRMAALVAQAR